jgi:nitric oxide reductase NorE protein
VSTISRNNYPRVDRPVRGKHIPGEEGTWVFIFGDMMVFAVFFATYLYYRGQQKPLFEQSQHSLVQLYGVINTLLLLLSSLFVVVGVRSVRQRRTTAAPAMFVCAMACGVVFSGIKALEWGEKVAHGITVSTNSFFLYYFLLTGLHFFHLLVGMSILAFIVKASRRSEISTKCFALVEGGACYWHMVDLLWIVLFPLLYLIR